MKRYPLEYDELGMQYEELVEAGELDPKKVSMQDYIEDVVSSAIDDAQDRGDYER